MPASVRRFGTLLGRLVFYPAAVLVGLPLAFSHVMTRTYGAPGGAPPGGWREITLLSQGLRLRAWTSAEGGVRAPVVVAHGLGDRLESQRGLGDRLRDRGHPVVLLDLRGHGGSEGRHTTLGGLEAMDVRAALEHVASLGRPAVLVGVSMGAVAALRAAAGREDVAAVVAEAPYDSYRQTVRHHAWLFYRMPQWVPLIPLSVAAAEWRAGFDADEVDAVAAARSLRAPLLAIVDGADPRMPEAVVRRVFEAHPGPKRLWVAPGAAHAAAALDPGYWPVVTSFLADNGL